MCTFNSAGKAVLSQFHTAALKCIVKEYSVGKLFGYGFFRNPLSYLQEQQHCSYGDDAHNPLSHYTLSTTLMSFRVHTDNYKLFVVYSLYIVVYIKLHFMQLYAVQQNFVLQKKTVLMTVL